MTRRSRPATAIGLVAGSIVTGLFLAEVLLWLLLPLQYPFQDSRVVRHYIRQAHEPNMQRLIVPEPGLPGVQGVNRWTTNNLGFRGDDIERPKAEDEYRVFLVGGSTVECAVLDNDDSLDAVVQAELERTFGRLMSIKVYNAGISGDRSDDHVAMLTQRIMHLEPDLIVVFAGINDLRAGLSGHDYLHFPVPARPLWKLLAAQPQLGRLAYSVLKGRPLWRVVDADTPIETNYRIAIQAQERASEANEPPQPNITAYANNLKTLAGLVRGHGLPLVFMTQQTTWNSAVDPRASDWHWLRRVGDIRYDEEAMDAALGLMNDTMRDIARSRGLAVYDLANDMPKSSDYFYDDAHFNTNGAAFAGRALAAVIADVIAARSS